MVVLLGGNDFLRRVPTAMTEKSLNEMVRRIQDRGAMVVLVGLKLGLFTNEYSPIYERVAEQNRALLIPNVLKGILSDAKLKSDQIHPNGAGYRKMAERILEKVKMLLEEADRRREGR